MLKEPVVLNVFLNQCSEGQKVMIKTHSRQVKALFLYRLLKVLTST